MCPQTKPHNCHRENWQFAVRNNQNRWRTDWKPIMHHIHRTKKTPRRTNKSRFKHANATIYWKCDRGDKWNGPYIYLLSAPYCPSFGCEPKRIMQLNDDCLKLAAWQRQAAGLHLALHNNISGDGHHRSRKEKLATPSKVPQTWRGAPVCTWSRTQVAWKKLFFRVCGY